MSATDLVVGTQCTSLPLSFDTHQLPLFLLQLGAVYLFEYMARGAASKARPKVSSLLFLLSSHVTSLIISVCLLLPG